MKIKTKTEALNIVETSYLASLSSLLWVALYYLPIGGALLRLILPLPMILLHLRRGSKIALEGLLIQFLLLFIIMGPVRGTLFLFVFVSNWGGALIPWRLIKLPSGELGAPTADINTTIALALLVSLSYFYAGLSNKGWRYFEYYVHPTPIMLPFKILEDFTKPLSLSFRLFGNILADELVVGVLVFLVPLILPIPVMFLGLFTSAIQALIFATLAAYYIGEAVEEHH